MRRSTRDWWRRFRGRRGGSRRVMRGRRERGRERGRWVGFWGITRARRGFCTASVGWPRLYHRHSDNAKEHRGSENRAVTNSYIGTKSKRVSSEQLPETGKQKVSLSLKSAAQTPTFTRHHTLSTTRSPTQHATLQEPSPAALIDLDLPRLPPSLQPPPTHSTDPPKSPTSPPSPPHPSLPAAK